MIVQPYKTRNVQRLRIALPVDGHGHVTIQLSGNQKMRSVDVLKMVQLKVRKLSIMCKETLVPISTTRIVLMFQDALHALGLGETMILANGAVAPPCAVALLQPLHYLSLKTKRLNLTKATTTPVSSQLLQFSASAFSPSQPTIDRDQSRLQTTIIVSEKVTGKQLIQNKSKYFKKKSQEYYFKISNRYDDNSLFILHLFILISEVKFKHFDFSISQRNSNFKDFIITKILMNQK